MEFLKNIAKSLFGSSRSSKSKPAKRGAKSSKRKLKKAKRPVKAAKKKAAPRSAKKKAVKARPKTKAVKKGKKSAKKQPKLVKEALSLIPLGEVTHYFPHVQAAVVKIGQGEIREGEVLSFRGHTTNFKQPAKSMQIDHKPIQVAREGDEIGIRVKSRVRAGDKVYKV